MYLDFVAIQALKNKTMRIKDFILQLNTLLSFEEDVLQNSGTISNKVAMEKAAEEYRKYQTKKISPVENAFFETIKDIYKVTKDKKK